MDKKPKDTQEFQNIMTAEVYNSLYIDYHICSDEVKELYETNVSQYDHYETYLSEQVAVLVLKDFHNGLLERLDLTTTYSFIMEMVMFQNTSLAKTNIKTTEALAHNGDISDSEVLSLYKDFGRSIRFWEIHNFKYAGTQAEAKRLTKAFANEELKQTYYEHQEFLEHIVELKNSQVEARNGMILNVLAIILALLDTSSYFVDVLKEFYEKFGINAKYAIIERSAYEFFCQACIGIQTLF